MSVDLSHHQLILAAKHLLAQLGALSAERLPHLDLPALTATLKGRLERSDQLQDDFARERAETAGVEDRAVGLRARVQHMFQLVHRYLEYLELARKHQPDQVAAARETIFEGLAPSTLAQSYTRAADGLGRLVQALKLYPWLDHDGTLAGQAKDLSATYAAFLEQREAELHQDDTTRAARNQAEEALSEAYRGAKELVQAENRLNPKTPLPLATLFLDEDPRWAARLSDRPDPTETTQTPSTPQTAPTPKTTPSVTKQTPADSGNDNTPA